MPTRPRFRFALAASALVAGAAAAVGTAPPSAGPGYDAVTRADRDLALAFTVPGAVRTVDVEPGDEVVAGAPLVRLEDDVVAARVRLLEVRAASTLAADEAAAALALAENEEKRVREAFEGGAMADFELERARLETLRLRVALDLARQRQTEAGLLLEQARAERARYTLTAPVDGFVDDVLVDPGESVQALRPVVRLVAIDPLVIDAAVPTESTRGLRVGGGAWIVGPGEGVGDARRGEIVHMARVADAASGTRRVRIRLANPEGRPAGEQVVVRFGSAGDRP